MVIKAFSNSIEISKAISLMNELRILHEHFCERARLFANDHTQILNSFDLMEQGEDPLTTMFNGLCSEYKKIEVQINVW